MPGAVVYKPIDRVDVGEQLARDLRDNAGVQLVRAGVVLDPAILEQLRRLGIESVPVLAADGRGEQEASTSRVSASLDHVFRHWKLSPRMQHLRAVLGAHRGEGSQ